MPVSRKRKMLRWFAVCALPFSVGTFPPVGSFAQQPQFSSLPSPPRAGSSNYDTLAPMTAQSIPAATPTAGGVQQVNFESMAGTAPSHVYQLQGESCSSFENALVQFWLQNPNAKVVDNGKTVWVSVPSPVPTMLAIDRATSQVKIHSDAKTGAACQAIVEAIDTCSAKGQAIRVESLQNAKPEFVNEVAGALGVAVFRGQPTFLTSTAAGAKPLPQDETLPGGQQDLKPGTRLITRTTDEQGQELTGPVRVQVFPELNAIVIYGPPEDVKKVQATINQIISTAKETQPKVDRYPLKGADPQNLADTIQSVYDDIYSANLGAASVRPIPDPRGLLIIGRAEAIEAIKKLAEEYDRPAPETPVEPNFKTYKLRYISAADFAQRVNAYFSQLPNPSLQAPGNPIPVITIADYRSNTVIVKGTKANFDQVDQLRKELDVDESDAVNMVKVFHLKNSLADQLAVSLQDALNGQQQNAGRGFTGNQQNNFNQTQNQNNLFGGQGATGSNLRSPALQMMTVDRDGNKVNGGIMFDVRVTSNASNNSITVSAPPAAMDLIASLVEELDTIPTVETQIKVFQIINGDAQTLLTMMQTLFGAAQNQGGQQGTLGGGAAGGQNTLQLPSQTSTQTAGMTLANMRFGVDIRTNSIVVTGPVGDLMVVESLLTRLDEEELAARRVAVIRLSNAPVADIAEAVQGWLDSRQTNITQADPGFTNAKVQSRRQVIIQPEVVSNQMIIYALPEYMEETLRVIRHLDRRPPMLKIKTMIAEVNLSMLEQLGIDLGLQDSLLFDRGIGSIGFPFNQSGIGNNSDAVSLATRPNVAGQALSNLGTGRVNTDLGYGGLVLSAGSESVNVLLRALQDKQCVRILDKPHLMTLENQQGRFQSGATVARINGVTTGNFGITNNIVDTDVGIILEVTPRVSQDGMIVMFVNAVKSSLGKEADGVPVFVNANGQIIRSPNINKIQVQSTIMARSGQTVVLSGLITESKTKTQRGAPFLSDLPLVGPLFRFETEIDSRKELLIIMTPMLVDSEEDLDAVNWDEQDRMHWCLQDVAEIYGSTSFDANPVYQSPPVYYPDADPLGQHPEIDEPLYYEPATGSLPNESPMQDPSTSTRGPNSANDRQVAGIERGTIRPQGTPKSSFTAFPETNSSQFGANPQSTPERPQTGVTAAGYREEEGTANSTTPKRSIGSGFRNYIPQSLGGKKQDSNSTNSDLNDEARGYKKNPFVNGN